MARGTPTEHRVSEQTRGGRSRQAVKGDRMKNQQSATKGAVEHEDRQFLVFSENLSEDPAGLHADSVD